MYLKSCGDDALLRTGPGLDEPGAKDAERTAPSYFPGKLLTQPGTVRSSGEPFAGLETGPDRAACPSGRLWGPGRSLGSVATACCP